MLTLSMGANAALNRSRFEVVIEWLPVLGTLDCSVYLLKADGKVRNDDDMIFYNQTSHPSGAVQMTRMEPGRTHVAIDLGSVSSEVQRIAFCATIEEQGRTMAALNGMSVGVRSNGEEDFRFVPDLSSASEVALRLIDVYRRGTEWKIRAVGQGYNDGLAPLARSFGIDVADDEPAPLQSHTEQRNTGPASPNQDSTSADLSETARTSPTVEGPINLSGSKSEHTWIVTPVDHLGAVSAKLEWSSQSGSSRRARPLQMALGCLFELEDGRRGAVQSWDYNGLFDMAPYVELLPLSGDNGLGSQTLRINGEQLRSIKRLALYGFIPAGAPNLRSSKIKLELSATNRKVVVLEVDGGVDGYGMLSLVGIENRDGNLFVKKIAKFLPGHHELDHDLTWGLSWRLRNRT